LSLLFAALPASAQDRPPPPLSLGGVYPGGVRHSATESWGAWDFNLTNRTDGDRQARVYVLFVRPDGQPDDVQYGREVWVPAQSSLATWMLVGPARKSGELSCEVQVLLYDRTGGTDRLLLPPGEERIRSRAVLYKKREPTTAVFLGYQPPEPIQFGVLPSPDSPAEEVVHLARTFRSSMNLVPVVEVVHPGMLPPTPEAFDGIDHFVLASGLILEDPAGLRALRRWLERGGHLWILLDRVPSDVLAPLLGDAYDFQIVDRVSLTTIPVLKRAIGKAVGEPDVQEHERAVDFVRVLLPAHEQPPHTVNGWPAWFTRDVGRGKVVLTALGPRAWYRPRTPRDPASPYDQFPMLPVRTATLDRVAYELQPPPEAEPFRPEEALQPLLSEEIGYSVVGRGSVAMVFGAALLLAVVLGFALRRSRHPELLGWLGPIAAVGAAVVFVAFGEASRRTAGPSVAVAQVAESVGGIAEVPVQGLLAAYRPEPGPAPAGVSQGGLFDLDLSGSEGQARRLVLTDRDAWHWENLNLTAGLRLGPFRYTAATGEPLEAVAHFGPDGLEGRLAAGPFQNVGDALLNMPGCRNLAVRFGPDGSFRAGRQDVLPPGEFLTGAVLTDRQQRRQEFYRAYLKKPAGRLENQPALLAWADPLDMHFELVADARTTGNAFLAVPLRLERSAAGVQATIPGPFLPYMRLIDSGPIRATMESNRSIEMHLRFQLPPAVLPFTVEQARLIGKVETPSRTFTVTAPGADGRPVEVYRVESPLDPIRVPIAEPALLRLDAQGGLHLNLLVSDPIVAQKQKQKGGPPGGEQQRWAIDFLELEVSGRTQSGGNKE
jgi:hypothetical protein